MTPSPSRRSQIPPFQVMEVMRRAADREAGGDEVLHLEVGQPGTPAPSGARAAAVAGVGTDKLGYTNALGLPALRARISQWYLERDRVDVDPSRVVVTTGASGSCVLAFLALFDVGDRVAVLEPGYPCYRNDPEAFGVEVVPVPVGPETGYRPTLDQLDEAGLLHGLVLASPSNPTGTILDAETLRAVRDWARRGGIHLVVDEIYRGISYGESAPTMLALDDDVVVFNSFSKYFSMTGWRLGWIVAPDWLVPTLERLAQNLTIAPPTLSQLAGIAAFDCTDELDANVERYRTHRRILLDGLRSIGLDRFAPAEGAFFVWVDVADLGLDSSTLCRRWLDELGVAATPGVDFDPVRGHDFVRFSYAGTDHDIREALNRLAAWTNDRLGAMQ